MRVGEGEGLPNRALRSDLRFSLRCASWNAGGVPARASDVYDPFHVDRFFMRSVGGVARGGEPGCESGRWESLKANVDFIGDGGAYISASCASSECDVMAERSCRTLSHCV